MTSSRSCLSSCGPVFVAACHQHESKSQESLSLSVSIAGSAMITTVPSTCRTARRNSIIAEVGNGETAVQQHAHAGGVR